MAVKGVHGYQGYDGFKDAKHGKHKDYENLATKKNGKDSKMKESKKHSAMIDNRMVKDDHQQGIARVLQRGKVEKTWQDGAMSMKGAGPKGSFKRSGGSLTPRKA